jgi:hypothetical protein
VRSRAENAAGYETFIFGRFLSGADLAQSRFPATLEFRGDETIVGIDPFQLPFDQSRRVPLPLELMFRTGAGAGAGGCRVYDRAIRPRRKSSTRCCRPADAVAPCAHWLRQDRQAATAAAQCGAIGDGDVDFEHVGDRSQQLLARAQYVVGRLYPGIGVLFSIDSYSFLLANSAVPCGPVMFPQFPR